jgi:LuxR family maltose regulon positive regulatory protein
MVTSDMRQQTGRPQDVGRPAFDLVAAKLMRPLVRPGTIRRLPLIERLTGDDARPIVSVVAPAGYGKTTLLSQWAERNGQAVAWVSVDGGDNDPKVLLTYVAEALNAVEPLGQRVFGALASPTSSVPGSVVPRLGAAFASMTTPVVLILDDVHLLHDTECRSALSVLADHVPAGSRLVLAGRDSPPLRVARLRAEGRILEIGPGDLSLTAEEAASLLRAAEAVLGDDDVTELHRRTEGWPVGLYLAALYLREGGPLPGAAASFGGDDRFVSEYMESEFLARIPSSQRVFLTRTAVLERMSGPLCEAVLELPGSGAILADLARSNLLLVPLDRRGQWYRYHHLFRDMLLAELERLEPELTSALRRRAAAWYLQNDLPEDAVEYYMAARDVDAAASLVAQLWLVTYRQGRGATALRWLRWLEDRGGIERHPMLAVGASMVFVNLGHPAEAERWADVLDRSQYQDPARLHDPATEAWVAAVRAFFCRQGVEQMRADADEAARKAVEAGIAIPAAVMAQGIARVLCGDREGGDAFLAAAASAREADMTVETIAHSLSEQSLLAIARGDWRQAQALVEKAHNALRRAGSANTLVSALQARIALHHGDIRAARQELVTAQQMRPLLTSALPYFAVQARIELTRVHLALSDLAGARTLMREIDEVLKRRPGLGTLVGEAQALRTQLAKVRGTSVPGASALTAADARGLDLPQTRRRQPRPGGRPGPGTGPARRLTEHHYSFTRQPPTACPPVVEDIPPSGVSPGVCLEWSTTRALAAGATEDEITDVLLAIAPVAGLGRVTAAVPSMAAALGYDVDAALLDPDDH